ncbi:MAG: hypothetical protein ACNA8W_02155, partial [Bradymonadaceae bacterium]
EENGSQAKESGHLARSLILLAKAEELEPTPERREAIAELRDEVIERHGYRVGWQSPSSRTPSSWTHVLERYGHWRGPRGLMVGEAPTGDQPGALTHLEVGLPFYDRDRSTRTVTARYQSGTRLVENPTYKSRQDDVTRQQRRVMDAENDVTKLEQDVSRYGAEVQRQGDTGNTVTGMQQNLSRAQSRLESARRKLVDERRNLQRTQESLNNTDQFNEEPVYADHQYTVTTHTIRGRLSLAGTIKGRDERDSVTLDEVVEVVARDEEHDAQPIINVGARRLDLPSEQELANELYIGGARALAEGVWHSFYLYRQRLIERAQRAGAPEEEVDLLVIYMLLDLEDFDSAVPLSISSLEDIPNPVSVLQMIQK